MIAFLKVKISLLLKSFFPSLGAKILGGVSLPLARVQAHQLKDEFALKILLAKYNLRKSGSQSNMISGTTSEPTG